MARKQVTSNTVDPVALLVPALYSDDKPSRHPKCKLCNSKFCLEAEQLYAKNGNAQAVWRFLTEHRQIDISPTAVRAHLANHVLRPDLAQMERECAEEIVKWMELPHDGESALRRMVAILDKEIWALESQANALPLMERRKNAETINKLMVTKLNYEVRLHDMKMANEPVIQVFHQLQIILQNQIRDNPDVRPVAINIVDQLKQSCSDLLIE